MAKSQKRVATALVLVALLLLSVCMFSACGSKDYTVTFMIEGKSEVVSVVDGKVTPPEDPTKDGYIFRGWYTDEAFTSPFDANAEIKENMTVYAYFVPVSVNVHVNGEDKGEMQMKNYDTFTKGYQDDALSQNLTFDGWYIDAGYTTKYTTQDVDDLYARYMAEVVFDNGYETVYTTLVQPDTVMKKPSAENIVKYYMDSEDLSYVTADGNAFSFSTKITTNITLTVLWKTPGLAYEKISGSNYAVIGISNDYTDEMANWPVLSILSENVTIDSDGTKGTVVSLVNSGVTNKTRSFGYTSPYKVIFNKGIQYISKFNSIENMEEVVLPSSLVILEESFWNCTNLKSLTIPDGVEVIIDCFWKSFHTGIHDSYRGSLNYDFEIAIPDSVTNLVLAPTNLSFGENSPYFYEDHRLYKQDGSDKILVSDYHSNVANGTLTIPEGVTGIWVGAIEIGDGVEQNGPGYKYLYLPSTLTKIVYNADVNDDKYTSFYTGSLLTDIDRVKAPDESSNPRSYSIVRQLGAITYVMFNTTSYPFDDYYYYFNDSKTAFNALTEEKLVFVGAVTEGDITITVKSTNTMGDGTVSPYTYTVATGTELVEENFLKQIGVTSEALGINIKVTSITQFAQKYTFGVKNANQYIDITYEYDVTGFTYTENADGTLTVTGFDEATAQNLGTKENPGPYLVVIPNMLNGKEIVAIADGAFKNVQKLSRIYISSSVKKIGYEAFAYTENLEYVNIAPGGLEEIGQYAFYNAGAIYDSASGKYVVNPNLPNLKVNWNDSKGTPSIEIYIPLGNLKTDLVGENGDYWCAIGEYAFCTPAIACFQPVAGEENRLAPIGSAMADDYSSAWLEEYEGLKPGMFFWKRDMSGGYLGIYRYVSNTTVIKPEKSDGSGEYEVAVYDVQYVATAAGYKKEALYLGYTMRKYTQYWDSTNAFYAGWCGYVMRYEVMEGSVYYNANVWLGVVSKVHTNAFTHMGDSILTYYYADQDEWLTEETIATQDPSVFEEGWWCGNRNEENTFMEEMRSSDPLFT